MTTLSMNQESSKKTPFSAILSAIFFVSGVSALVYQVAWQRLLTVYYGVGSISITLIVSVYMLGLGLGAYFGGRLAERLKNRIFAYFLIELTIGIFGLASPFLLDALGKMTAGSSYSVSLLCMTAFLILPTTLMGATLPLLTKIFNRIIQNFLHVVSLLYFVNTLGAAVGALVASYVLVSLWGLDIAVYIAASINIVLAVVVLWLNQTNLEKQEPAREEAPVSQSDDSDSLPLAVALGLVFVTGFLAIGYEIVWFRMIGVLVKASPYAFSTVLSVYLIGIAFGSFGVDRYLKKNPQVNKKALYFSFQFFIGLSVLVICLGYYYLTKHTPFGGFTRVSFATDLHPHFGPLVTTSPAAMFKDIFSRVDVLVWSCFFVLIPTLFMGGSFPLVAELSRKDSGHEASTIGSVYFFTILGNVMGGFVTGFFLFASLGTEQTLQLFILIGLCFGIMTLKFQGRGLARLRKSGLLMLCIFAVLLLFPGRQDLYKAMHAGPEGDYDAYYEEGIDGVIATYESGENVFNFINGLGHGGRGPITYGHYYQAIESLAQANDVENVLVIGYGTGAGTEIVTFLDEVKKITVVELSRDLMNNLNKMTVFRELLSDPRIELIIEDGRRFLLQNEEKYDVILMDPLRSTTSYSNNLYSKEFFELVASRLKPGGVMSVYMKEHQVMPQTALSVFPYLHFDKSFGVVSNQPLQKNHARYEKMLSRFDRPTRERIERMDEYLGDETYAATVGNPNVINRDWQPVCEYYLGLNSRLKSA